MIRLPPLTEPVKQTFAMSVFWMRPVMFSSVPVTTFSTPGGQLLGDALDDARRRQRCRGRRLHDRGVAREQGVGKCGAQDRDRPVERHDHRDDPERLVGHVGGDRDAPGTTGSVLPVSTSSAMHQGEVPSDLEQQCVDPSLEPHLAVLLRQDRGIRHPARQRCRRSPRPSAPRAAAALSAAQAGKASFAAATASATSSFDADAACPTMTPGLPGSAIARSGRSIALRTPDVQPRSNCLQRSSHDDQAPLCVLSSVMGTALCVHKQVYVHSCLLVNHIVLLSPRRPREVGIRPQASRRGRPWRVPQRRIDEEACDG